MWRWGGSPGLLWQCVILSREKFVTKFFKPQANSVRDSGRACWRVATGVGFFSHDFAHGFLEDPPWRRQAWGRTWRPCAWRGLFGPWHRRSISRQQRCKPRCSASEAWILSCAAVAMASWLAARKRKVQSFSRRYRLMKIADVLHRVLRGGVLFAIGEDGDDHLARLFRFRQAANAELRFP